MWTKTTFYYENNYLCRPNFIVMFAIVEISGKQYKVEKDQEIYVHRLQGNEGDKVQFDQVLLSSTEKAVTIGSPTTGKSVKATIVEHIKDDKVIVFKKKRRKGYKVKNGHRQSLTKIKITALA